MGSSSWLKKIAKPKHLGGLSLRAAREVNTCLLGKLVWDLTQRNIKLWVNILANKYSAGQIFLYASTTSSSSPTWSSIIRAKMFYLAVTPGEWDPVPPPFGSALGVILAPSGLLFPLLTFMTFTLLSKML